MEYDINKVSPRPWRKDGRDLWTEGRSYLGEMACPVTKECPACDANAAHIVHCVNVHDDLVAALEHEINRNHDHDATKCSACELAQKALARARGEK